LNLLVYFGQRRFIGLFHGQVEENVALIYFFGQFVESIQLGNYPCPLPENRFGVFGIVPEPVAGDLFFDIGQTFLLGGQVKDSP